MCASWRVRRASLALSAVVALGCALLAPVAQAQIADRVHETNGIIFVSGGIGADSREQLAAREKSYNFKLITTLEGSGKFVTAAQVTLTSATGAKLVEHVTEGPILLMGLPAGAYVISATFRGMTRTRKIQVRAERLLTEYMRWPADAEDGVLPPEPK